MYKNLQFPKDSTFLVTGGAGFIGSNLCEAILDMGYTVHCFDNLSVGKIDNIDLFIDNPKYKFIKGDICDFDACMKATHGVDFVLHHAALASVPQSLKCPTLYNDINVVGTLNMMEASHKNMVKRFVYASSSAIYGNGSKIPLSPYALSKSINEQYGSLYKNLYELNTYGLRYFNVFGKRQDPNNAYAAVIPTFIKQLLNNETPKIYGDGTNSRDFVYIDNIIEANLKACLSHENMAGQAFDIAYGKSISIVDMYKILLNILDKNIIPSFELERDGDVKHSTADISIAKDVLGYDPQYDFESGIKCVIEWYKKYYDKR